MYYYYYHCYYMAVLQSQRQIALGSQSAGAIRGCNPFLVDVAKRDEHISEYLKRHFSRSSCTCLIEGEG